MHKEIRPTDIQWLAQGWWRHYYKHKMSPGTAIHSTVSAITIGLGIVLVFIGLIASDGAETPLLPYIVVILVVGGLLMATAVILYIMAATIERQEEDKFIDYVADQWEAGSKDLPDTETVAEYLKIRELGR